MRYCFPASTGRNRLNVFNSQGFTLFEVLIAVSIFALIAALTMTNLIQVGKTGEKVSQAQLQLSEIQFALAYLGKDMAQLIERDIRDKYGDNQEALILDEEQFSFSRTGWGNLLQQGRSQQQRVSYNLEDSSLIRSYSVHLDQGYIDEPLKQVLLTNVEKFEVELLLKENETLSSWPPDATVIESISPVAVKVSLAIKGFGEIFRIYEIADGVLQHEP